MSIVTLDKSGTPQKTENHQIGVDSVEFCERLNEKSNIGFLIGAYIALDECKELSIAQQNRKEAFLNLIKKTDHRFISDYWVSLEKIISEGEVKPEDWTGDYSHHPQVIAYYRKISKWIGDYLSIKSLE